MVRHRAESDSANMARQPRLDLPGIPQYIVQRGNNRQPCFLDDTDRACYRYLLRDALLAAGSLMDIHMHLLAIESAAGAVGGTMQRLGRHSLSQFKARRAHRHALGGRLQDPSLATAMTTYCAATATSASTRHLPA